MPKRKLLGMAGLIVIATGAGFYVARYTSKTEYAITFPDISPSSLLTPLAPGATLACAALAGAVARENRLAHPTPTATAEAHPGVDKLSLKIAADGKGIYLLTAAAVSIGIMDADPIPRTRLPRCLKS